QHCGVAQGSAEPVSLRQSYCLAQVAHLQMSSRLAQHNGWQECLELPSRHTSCLLDPPLNLRRFRLFQRSQFYVAGTTGVSKRRRGIEVRAAKEDGIHRNIV